MDRQVNRHTDASNECPAVVECLAEEHLYRDTEQTEGLSFLPVIETGVEVIRYIGVAGVSKSGSDLVVVIQSRRIGVGVLQSYSQTNQIVEEPAVEQSALKAATDLVFAVSSLIEHGVQATAEAEAYVVLVLALLGADRDGQCHSGDE